MVLAENRPTKALTDNKNDKTNNKYIMVSIVRKWMIVEWYSDDACIHASFISRSRGSEDAFLPSQRKLKLSKEVSWLIIHCDFIAHRSHNFLRINIVFEI